jgi:peptidoglycan lytic transglycosylase G
MTVRSGRGPRDSDMPSWRASDGRGNPPLAPRRRPERSGFRVPGIIRFLLFTGVLAALVLVVLLTALRPVLRAGVVGWAWENPGAILRFPFVSDLVREDLGPALTTPAGSDPAESVFTVNSGDSVISLAPRLAQEGYIASERAFMFAAFQNGLSDKLSAGTFVLRGDMTPGEVADALIGARVTVTTEDITFREGLRIEQMTALLQTKETGVDPEKFYDIAKHPPAELLADYDWLKLPKGASLEGFLYPDTYQIVTAASGGPTPITDAEHLVRMLLDRFAEVVGEERMNVPESRHMTFYQVVTLASIVEHEAAVDEERPLIAGVYQNRLNGLHGIARILNADPTVTYATDTMALGAYSESWKDYFFWKVPPSPLSKVNVDADLQGYQTYQVAGLIPGPISTPSLASIEAALAPNTGTGYLYFVLIPDTKEHAFAKNFAQHQANLRKYGYL